MVVVLLVPVWTVPAAADSGQPGDIVSSGPSVFTLDPLLRLPMPGVKATSVTYRLTNAAGAPNVVLGARSSCLRFRSRPPPSVRW